MFARLAITAMLFAATPPTVATAVATTVTVDGSVVAARTSDHFACWNIDASENRGFFHRNLDPGLPFGRQLAVQAAAISAGQGQQSNGAHSLLRFGGGGNDMLTYEVGGAACSPPETPGQPNCT